MLHYYELSFYHDEDDNLADSEKRCSYCIKTEIPPVISDEVALSILFNKPFDPQLRENLTCVQEISQAEAESFFDVEDLTVRVTESFGTFYVRGN